MINRALLVSCLIGAGAAGVAAYASVPALPVLSAPPTGDAVSTPLNSLQADRGGRSRVNQAHSGASDGSFELAQLSGVETGGVVHASIPIAVPALVQIEGLQQPSSADAGGISQIAANQFCSRYRQASNEGLPLTKLVSVLTQGITDLGPRADTETIRVRVQAYLTLSHDGPDVKGQAVQDLRAAYSSKSVVGQALINPFDLTEPASAEVAGYDPCANPAAIGVGAFSQGPFSNTFSTINPAPIVQTRAVAITEGQT